MGQHTWFLKSKDIYLKELRAYEKLDSFEKGEMWLDDIELLQINNEIDELSNSNKTEYHDLFRTNKRNDDGTYTDTVIYSKEECIEFINDERNMISFKHTFDEMEEQKLINKKNSIKLLNKFWMEYPNGVIEFG